MLPGPYVVVLDFSRSPRAFREALLGPQLCDDCRKFLGGAGVSVTELDSGAKVLVFPERLEPVREAIRLTTSMPQHQHVIVDPEFEAIVFGLVQSLAGREKVRVRRRGTMPLALGPVDPRVSGDDAGSWRVEEAEAQAAGSQPQAAGRQPQAAGLQSQ